MSKRFLSPINLISLPSDPATGTEGDIYYNNVDDKIKMYSNGAWVIVGSTGTLPSGGSVGQILAKASNTDYAVEWIENYADYTEIVKLKVKNDGTRALYKGEPVYVTGSDGTNVLVGRSSNATEGGSSKTIGILEENLSTNGIGFVVKEGKLGTLDTSLAGAVGDPVWLGVDGALIYGLANKPYAPAHLVYLGVVTKKNSSTGEIFVQVQNGFELQELHNVSIGYGNSIADNELLAYDSTSSTWVNQTALEAKVAPLDSNNLIPPIHIPDYELLLVKNMESTTLSALTPVCIDTHPPGQLPTVRKADATDTLIASRMPAVGLTIESVTSESNTNIVTSGLISDLDLTGYADGDYLYVAVGGGFTTTRPNGSSTIQKVARIISVDNGTIFVYGNSSYEEMPGLSDGKVFIGNSSNVAIQQTLNTSLVPEVSNLYYTTERAQDDASALFTGGTHSGLTVDYVDGSNILNITNTGVLSISGVTGEINFTASTGTTQASLSQTFKDLVDSKAPSNAPTFTGSVSLPSTTHIGTITSIELGYLDGVSSPIQTQLDGKSSTSHDHTGTYQPVDAELTALANTTSDIDKLPYYTGAGTASTTTLTSFGRSLIDDTSAENARTTMGVVIGTDVQAHDPDLTAIAGLIGTAGFLKKTAADTWALDNSSYSTTSHNHTVDSLSNVVITGTPSDGQALVWDTTTSKWVNETVVQDLSSYLTILNAASTYQPKDQDLTDIAALSGNGILKKTAGAWGMDTSTYLTSYTETDTLETVTDRGATSTNAITISNTTQSTTPTTGALIISGGVGISKDVWIDGDLHVNGTTITENTQTVATHDNLIYLNAAQDTTVTNAVGDGTYVTYTAENNYTPGMDIRITGMDPSGYNISSADGLTVFSATSTQFIVAKTTTGSFVSGGTAHAKTEANPDLGFAGGYYNAGYAHAGLFRDATDGVFKIFDGYTPEPDESVNIDTTHASFSFAPIKVESLDVVDASTTRTNLGLAIGTNVQAYSSTLAGINTLGSGTGFLKNTGGTWSYDNSTYLTTGSASSTYAPINNPTFTGTVSGITKTMVGLGNVEDTALSTWAGSTNLTTLGTIATGTWNATAIGYTKGGTGLTSLGTAGQVLKVNATQDGLEWGVGASEASGVAAVTSDPPANPLTNQVWQDLDTGRIYIYDGTYWVEVQQNGSLGMLRYLGASATDPTYSIDGSDLQAGEVYYNTVDQRLRVYSGTVWKTVYTLEDIAGTTNEVQVTGGPGSVVIGLPDDVTIGRDLAVTRNLTVTGDLTVNGNTTTINTTQLLVEDDIVTLNSNVTGTPSGNAGVEVERGTLANVAIRWNETEDQWEYTNDGVEYQSIGSGGGAVSTMTALSNSFWLGA